MKEPEPKPNMRQEEDRLPPRLLLYVILAIIAFSLALGLISSLLQGYREHALRPSGNFSEKNLGPIHERAQVHEELFTNLGDGQMLLSAQRTKLGKFVWVDGEHKVVRVPIDVAMDIVVNEGAR
jgi:hypothetical protein